MAQIDIGSSAFAKRLANLMVATRHERRLTLRAMARQSGGRFSRRELKECEAGLRPLDEPTVLQLSGLYGCNMESILPARLPISVELGRITAGGVTAAFEPLSSTSLLEAYLRLVRSLRRQKNAAAVELRRDDIEVLAAYLQEAGEVVVERLGALMGATRGQRTAMAGLFATGAVVIGLVGTAAAAGTPSSSVSVPASGPSRVAVVAPATDDAGSTATTASNLREIVVAADVDRPSAAVGQSVAVDSAAAPTANEPPLVLIDDADFVDTDLPPIDAGDLVETGLPPVP